jgi:hypothetical protein
MSDFSKIQDPELAEMAVRGHRKIMADQGSEPARWILVDVSRQRLALLSGNRLDLVLPVSTAAAGIDCRQDSGGTPDGLHRIAEKIGQDQPVGAVFLSRKPTGECWTPGQPRAADEDLILTRILTLEGCEEGHNRGPGVDSRQRYIYIHGTNHEERIGQPVSHGCVRMRSGDILELFAQVEEGDPVVIL